MDRTSGRSSLVHGDPYLILRWWGKAHEFYAVQREQGREKPNLFLLVSDPGYQFDYLFRQ